MSEQKGNMDTHRCNLIYLSVNLFPSFNPPQVLHKNKQELYWGDNVHFTWTFYLSLN